MQLSSLLRPLLAVLFLPLFAFAAATGASAQTSPLVGDWEGELDLGQATFPIVIHITEDGGTYDATLDSPAQGAFGIESEDVMVTADSFSVSFPSVQATMMGSLLGEDEVSATFEQAGRSYEMMLMPAAAPAPTVEPNDALAPALGSWKLEEGTQGFPPGFSLGFEEGSAADTLIATFSIQNQVQGARLGGAYLEGDSLVVPFPPAGDAEFRGVLTDVDYEAVFYVQGNEVPVRFIRDYPASDALQPFVGQWSGWAPAGDGGSGLIVGMELSTTPDSTELVATIDHPDFGETPGTAVMDGDMLVVTADEAQVQMRLTRNEDEEETTLTGSSINNADGSERAITFREGAGRPQTPRPPFSYGVEEVTFESVPGVTLAGTLTIPEGEGPFPAVVLVTGSGPQDRNEAAFGHQPFAVIADWMTKAGIAVLRYDDRGTARSTGSFAEATLTDFADDAAAAVRWLEARPETGDVGVLGHSEGGYVAPLVANMVDAVDFTVLLAGPAVSGAEVYAAQHADIAEASGLNAQDAEAYGDAVAALVAPFAEQPDAPIETLRADAVDAFRARLSEVSAAGRSQLGLSEGSAQPVIDQLVAFITTPGTRSFLAYDPAEALDALDVPTLALFGGKDLQVPAEQSVGPMREALSDVRGSSVMVYDDVNHFFQTAETGNITEYSEIDETIALPVLSKIEIWTKGVAEG